MSCDEGSQVVDEQGNGRWQLLGKEMCFKSWNLAGQVSELVLRSIFGMYLGSKV